MLEKIKRCKFCNEEMKVGFSSWVENPFCNKCLNQRIEEAKKKLGPFDWRRNGEYLELVPKMGQEEN